MSRTGKLPIQIPAGTEVSVVSSEIVVKGKGGTLRRFLHPAVSITVEGGVVTVTPKEKNRIGRALWGTFAAHVRNMLLQIQKERKLTIIFTSHNMLEVEQMCDRVALLHKGEIYKIDTPENLQKFLEVPSMEEVFIKLASGELENE